MITLIAIGVVLLQIFILATVFLALTNKSLLSMLSPWTTVLVRVILTGAVLGSLFFSEIKGFEPCLLCWWQRIFIFGAAILVWTGDIRKNTLLRTQVIVFSIIGLGVALVHNYIDLIPSSGLDICGTGVSCLKRYIDAFGYITIPMMSLTVLLAALTVTLVARFSSRYPHNTIAE
jgi:disulfide bond formation protein DsbB